MEQSLLIELDIPLAWRPFAGHADLDMAGMNAILLRALSALESTPGRDDDRLEAKLDLTLAVLTRLLHAKHPPPPRRHCSLSATTIVWTDEHPPAVGQDITILLHLSSLLPLPLALPAKVAAVSQDRCQAAIVHHDEESRDCLERTIFRQHRRQIQRLRGG